MKNQNRRAPHRASKSLSKKALLHNLSEIRSAISSTTKVMAVIKANAYGTDSVLFAKVLEKEDVDFFAVATIEEGIALRKKNIQAQILILGYTSPKRIKELQRYALIQSIISEEHALALNQQKVKVQCHLKVDTGMHRLGVEANAKKIKPLYDLPFLSIRGIFSHLGSSDRLTIAAVERTEQQITTYNQVIEELQQQKVKVGVTHLQSSYGILNYPNLNYDYVRPGVILYGFLSDETAESRIKLDIQPVVEIKAQLILKREVKPNEYIGYGLKTRFSSKRLIGVVSIGYCDGIPRELSFTNFYLSFSEQMIPQIGIICMDMLLVDLTGLEAIPIEAELTILSNMTKVAEDTNTVTNELLSRLGNRLAIKLER
ncbi:alanine racemase [Listeria sp. PSOL-1]|uniref:alanine racemase n=1 Tax=Listeria sp. PSOL-1 TaxID=1844999 RepID=UPI0013D00D9C|nr:alanine racemase [Listeria sp. PSOL-1]